MISNKFFIASFVFIIFSSLSVFSNGGTSCSTATIAVKGINTANNASGQGQFYTYTAASDAFLVLNSVGLATYDTKVYLYNNSCFYNSQIVLANNDNYLYSLQSKLMYEVKAGQTYIIGWSAASGTNNWRLHEEALPINTTCNSAISSNSLTDTIKIRQGSSSWYSYKATINGNALISLINNTNQKIAVYTSCNENDLIATSNFGSLVFACQKDSIYYIKYSYSGNTLLVRQIQESLSTASGYSCLNNKPAIEGVNYCNHQDLQNSYVYYQIFSYTLAFDAKVKISTKELTYIKSTVVVSKSCSLLDTFATNLTPFGGDDCSFYGKKGETFYFTWKYPKYTNENFYPWSLSLEPLAKPQQGINCDSPENLQLGFQKCDLSEYNKKWFRYVALDNGYLTVETDGSKGLYLAVHEHCDSTMNASSKFNMFLQKGQSVLMSLNINRNLTDAGIKYFTALFTASELSQGYSCNNPKMVKEGANYLTNGMNYFLFNAPDSGYISMYLIDAQKNNPLTRKVYNSCNDVNTINYFAKRIYPINSNTWDGFSVSKNSSNIFEWKSMENTDLFGWHFKFTPISKDHNFTAFSHSTRIAEAVIDTANHTVLLTLSKNATLVDIAVYFAAHSNAKVYIGTTLQKASITKNNFTAPVVYTVVAADGTSQNWTVTVAKATSLSNQNKFLSFQPSSIITPSEIDTINHVVKCYFWEDFNSLNSLSVNYSASLYSTIKLNGNVLGTAILNLAKDTVYTVTSESGQVQAWNIRVIKKAYPAGKSCATKLPANIGANSTNRYLEKNYYYFTATSNGELKFYNHCDVKDMYIGIWSKCDGTFLQGKNISKADTFNYVYYSGDSVFFTLTYSSSYSSIIKGEPFYIHFKTTQLSSANDILDFNIPNTRVANTFIDRQYKTIHVYPAYFSSLVSISTKLSIPIGAKAYLNGNTTSLVLSKDVFFNYSNPFTIRVVAHDGTTSDWTILAHVKNPSGDDITGFGFREQTGPAVLDTENHFIKVGVKTGTNVSNLIAYFTISPYANIRVGGTYQQSFITINNFTDTVNYEVISSDGKFQQWKVLVISGDTVKNTLTDFQSFHFVEQVEPTLINKTTHTIMVTLRKNIHLNALKAYFALSNGAKVTVAGAPQISGTTVNNFNNTLNYLVTAEDGITTQLWQVTATLSPQYFANILTYSIDGAISTTIDSKNNTINIVMPNNSNLAALISSFTLSDGASCKINNTSQMSGVSVVNFIDIVKYTVSAKNNDTTIVWNVIVKKQAEIDIEQNTIEPMLYTVFPNPSDGLFNIMHTSEQQELMIEIYNALGQRVYVGRTAKFQDHLQINLSNELKGLYFVRISSMLGNQTLKLIVE